MKESKQSEVPGVESSFLFEGDMGTFKPMVAELTIDQKDMVGQRYDEYLRDFLVGFVRQSRCKLIRQQAFVLEGHLGVEMLLQSFSGAQIMSRAILVGNRTYSVSAICFPDTFAPTGARRYLNSLALPKGTPRGPFNSPEPPFATYNDPAGLLSVDLLGPPSAKSIPRKVEGHSFTIELRKATFLNKVTGLVYVDLPSTAQLEKDEDLISTLMEAISHTILSEASAERKRSFKYNLNGHEVRSLSFVASDGLQEGRMDAVVVGNRLIAFLAIAPQHTLNSPEINRFFRSIKLKK
jgi:hypothetical protein